MATNRGDVAAPLETVWAVLADPRQYANFVVGTKQIRHFDPRWPAQGATLHHSLGAGAALVHDRTDVLAEEGPRALRLRAGMGPMGASIVAFGLAPTGTGETQVTLEEHPIDGPAARVWNPLFDALLWLRNVEVLRRIRHLAEHRLASSA